MEKGKRLDTYLAENGFAETKSQAQALIMAGNIKVNGETITKCAYTVKEDTTPNIEVKLLPFVSRGGFKIEKAIKEFGIDLTDKICIDAGASTGGFTDCMLQNGAKKIYAVDVGYGQLAWKIRQDERVVTIERTNIKNCSFLDIFENETSEKADFCSMDLSFISIKKVLPNIKNFLNEKGEVVALIKPQFEAERKDIGKNGVVKSKEVHLKIIKDITEFAISIGFFVKNLTVSPIKGPKGNIEYLIYLTILPTGNINIDEKFEMIKDFE